LIFYMRLNIFFLLFSFNPTFYAQIYSFYTWISFITAATQYEAQLGDIKAACSDWEIAKYNGIEYADKMIETYCGSCDQSKCLKGHLLITLKPIKLQKEPIGTVN